MCDNNVDRLYNSANDTDTHKSNNEHYAGLLCN